MNVSQKPGFSLGVSPKVAWVILSHVGRVMVVCPCPWIAHERTMENAGANMFRAVPVMVWFPLKFMAAMPSRLEKTIPLKAAIRIARNMASCGWAGPHPDRLKALRVRQLTRAPIIMTPSRARFMTPLRSENIPPSATIRRGTANITVALRISANIFIVVLLSGDLRAVAHIHDLLFLVPVQ